MAQEIFTVTGESTRTLAAARTVTTVTHQVTILGSRPQTLSTQSPRRLMQAGWWGVVANVATPSVRTILWWKYIDLELETYKVTLNGLADGIIFRLNSGLTAVLTVGP